MHFDLIVSQGRVGDKTAQTIAGAAHTAKALEQQFGAKGISVGKFSEPKNDTWKESLPEAKNTLNEISTAFSERLPAKHPIVFTSNTCSASLATLPLVAKHHPDAFVLWFDAHGDFNTPDTTDTGYLGGMVLAAACGLWDSGQGAGLNPEKLILVGAHDIDPLERELLQKAGVKIIPPREVTAQAVLDLVGDAQLWIHVDWDVLEPGFIPADYQVTGGLVLSQIYDVFSAIPAKQLLGLELAEFKAPDCQDAVNAALANILETVSPLLK